MIYEVVGKVDPVPTSQGVAGPNQVAGMTRQHESTRIQKAHFWNKHVPSNSEEKYGTIGPVEMGSITEVREGVYSGENKDYIQGGPPCVDSPLDYMIVELWGPLPT